MRLAWVLGLAGLLPFLFGLFLTLNGEQARTLVPGLSPDGPRLMLSYGAVILSFMGAIHWGAALEREPEAGWPYALSVVPAFYGWLIWGLSLMSPGDIALLMIGLALGFAALLVVDLIRGRAGDFPKWYPPLRVVLTLGAAGGLVAAGLYSM